MTAADANDSHLLTAHVIQVNGGDSEDGTTGDGTTGDGTAAVFLCLPHSVAFFNG
jgi:hypothetical protein